MSDRAIDHWLARYGDSHQNPTNKAIHWLAVPTIFWTLVAVLWSLPWPFPGFPWLNWALVALLPVWGFYLSLSAALALGMVLFSAGCLVLCVLLNAALPWPLWLFAMVLFGLMWALQFIGHAVEGKRPSFFTDLQFLLIGPAWLLAFIYRAAGWRY